MSLFSFAVCMSCTLLNLLTARWDSAWLWWSLGMSLLLWASHGYVRLRAVRYDIEAWSEWAEVAMHRSALNARRKRFSRSVASISRTLSSQRVVH